MIAAALTAMLFTPAVGAPTADVEQVAISAELERSDREFLFENKSPAWQLLLFGSHELGATQTLTVAPGGQVQLPCTPEAVEGVTLEVLQAMDSGRISSSGGIWLQSLDYVEHGRAVLVEGARGLVTWVATDGEGVVARTSGTLLATHSYVASELIEAPSLVSFNVPVITPRSTGNHDPIKRVPLPPV